MLSPVKARSVSFVLAALVLVGSLPASAQPVSSLLDRLERKYDSIQALRASFTQTLKSAFSGETASMEGKLVLAGEKYRVETKSQTMVTDGKTTWIYLADENQVLINSADTEEGGFSPSEFFTDFEENYNVNLVSTQTLDGAKHFVLKLEPKKPDSFFETATVWMRDRDNMITQMEVLDVNETTMFFKMKNIEENPTLPAGTFAFKTPAGAEVIDLREQ